MTTPTPYANERAAISAALDAIAKAHGQELFISSAYWPHGIIVGTISEYLAKVAKDETGDCMSYAMARAKQQPAAVGDGERCEACGTVVQPGDGHGRWADDVLTCAKHSPPKATIAVAGEPATAWEREIAAATPAPSAPAQAVELLRELVYCDDWMGEEQSKEHQECLNRARAFLATQPTEASTSATAPRGRSGSRSGARGIASGSRPPVQQLPRRRAQRLRNRSQVSQRWLPALRLVQVH